jgi:hypothetical protein
VSQLIDFRDAFLSRDEYADNWILNVSGMLPCANMQLGLSPECHSALPHFWRIHLVGHLPNGFCLRRSESFHLRIPITGITGSIGVELVGATMSKRFEVEPSALPA